MNYSNLKFKVDFQGHVKNDKIDILFRTVYLLKKHSAFTLLFVH